MATYIEDEETGKLFEEYARLEGKSKTGALHDLLKREIARSKKSAEDRYRDLLAYVASTPTEKTPVSEADVASLYSHLDVD